MVLIVIWLASGGGPFQNCIRDEEGIERSKICEQTNYSDLNIEHEPNRDVSKTLLIKDLFKCQSEKKRLTTYQSIIINQNLNSKFPKIGHTTFYATD